MPETTDQNRLRLEPGEQALASVESMGSSLSSLPDDAFENLLVVSATAAPSRIESLIERRGGDPAKVGVVPVTGSSYEYDGPVWTTDSVNPSDLTGISIRLSQALKYVTSDGWVVFDDVNVLLMYTREEQVYRLLDSVVESTRAKGARSVYCVVRDAMTDETYARLQSLCDRERSLE